MTLLKIGERFLNVNRVTEYTLDGTDVIVHFGPDHTTRFARHDAVLLRKWLELTAVDLATDASEPAAASQQVILEPSNRDGSPADTPQPSRGNKLFELDRALRRPPRG